MFQEATPAPISVLVVEDDPTTRRRICMAIESHPALKLVAALDNVRVALHWLENRSVDVLLTDLGLPDGSGLDIISACARLHPRTDIMVVTMSSDEVNVLACIEAGASGYILKDAVRNDLVQQLLDLRAGGSPMSPGVARMVIAKVRGNKKPPLPDVESGDTAGLSKREASILELIARGNSYNEVAKQLALSVGTVQSHIKHIYAKLQVHSRSAAVHEAHRRGFLKYGEVKVKKPGAAAPEAVR
jgi:DNA-binding NarL/FixJ family response regulator